MSNQPPQPFGRVRLPQVIETWAAENPLNPRMLASELADVLRSLGPAPQVLGANAASVTLYDPATGPGGVTIEALADYFERYSAGEPADTIETTNGMAQAGAVLLAKQWIGRLESEAEARATLAAGLQQTTVAPAPTGGALPTTQQQPYLSGSGPECLTLRQEQQRQDGESTASENLDAAQQQAQRLERENERLRARLASLEQYHQQSLEDAELHRRAAEDERRARTLAEDQLREHAGIIAFMDTDNPLAPVEGQRMVAAWCDLTNNGTEDNVSTKGKGLSELLRVWIDKNIGEPAAVTVKRYTWALTWPARKKGGAVTKRGREKG